MSIGCYDADMQKYLHVPYNLELMKLSTYYKRKGEIVSLAPIFRPARYTKFLYRKDFDDGDFRQEIFTTPNIEWGGQAFSGDVYIPLDEKIEQLKPDTYLYNHMKDTFSNQMQYAAAFKVMENANHFRLSLDGKTIWKDFTKQFTWPRPYTWFIHDFDLNKIEGAYELISDLIDYDCLAHRRAAIGNKFPIQVNNEEDLLKWCKLQPAQKFFSLQYNGVMENNTLDKFLNSCRHTSIPRQLDYIVTAARYEENDFLTRLLPKIYLQICFLRREKVQISLKYENNFFSNPLWGRVLELFNCYLTGFLRFNRERQDASINYDTLYSFCRSFKDRVNHCERFPFTLDEAREIFIFVAENNYDLFRMFYECSNVRLENGELIPI